MDQITLRIIDGPDVGTVFNELSLPVTIGREKGNTIELHDDRISRFHAKILEDNGSVLLVDMGSTNGTWVNGNIIQFWVLRPGDLITVGCTRFLFGSRLEIVARINKIQKKINYNDNYFPDPSLQLFNSTSAVTTETSQSCVQVWEKTLNSVLNSDQFTDKEIELLKGAFPPVLPNNLSPCQIASMTQFFTYFMMRFRSLLSDIKIDDENKSDIDESSAGDFGVRKVKSFFSRKRRKQERIKLPKGSVILNFHQYQNMLDIVSLFAGYLGNLSKDPNWQAQCGNLGEDSWWDSKNDTDKVWED